MHRSAIIARPRDFQLFRFFTEEGAPPVFTRKIGCRKLEGIYPWICKRLSIKDNPQVLTNTRWWSAPPCTFQREGEGEGETLSAGRNSLPGPFRPHRGHKLDSHAGASAAGQASVSGPSHFSDRSSRPPDQQRVLSPISSVSSSSDSEDGAVPTNSAARDQGTITDICNTSSDVEVELVSLLEEQIPCYKLRADTITQFSGYENEDWYIHTPVIPPDTQVDLSPELIHETLKYFVLCGDRLSQMTKTYNDIDAVTRLLEEKERDLELAARIGQSLLDQNKELRQRNEFLEHEITSANDTVDRLSTELIACTDWVTQLRHELSLKNGLLQIYSQDLDTDSEAGTPTRERSFIANWELLQKKIHVLEDENVQLKTEATLRTEDIEEEERKEMQLISDCVKQLGEANLQKCLLQDEIAKKGEDTIRQQEEITQLLSQVVELQRKNRLLNVENEELQSKLAVVQECQGELSAELLEMKERYGELLACFQELQEETRRNSRQRSGLFLPPMPSPTSGSQWPLCGIYSPGCANPDSLASELLESSLGSDGYASDDRASSNQSRRIFQTVKYANSGRSGRLPRRHSHQPLSLQAAQQHPPGSTMGIGHTTKFSSWGHLSHLTTGVSLASDSESAYTDSYHTDDESLYSSLSSTGKSATVGSDPREGESCATELAAALRQMGQPLEERGSGCRTPDSVLSCESGMSAGKHFTYYLQQGIGTKNYHLPDKLKIVKPLEGSQTLHHWQRLATPHLGALFESRPGVQVKGGDPKAEEEELNRDPTTMPVVDDQKEDDFLFSDLEEDDDFDYLHPGKSFMDTSSVYTYTNSTILHPSDQTVVTASYSRLQLSTGASVGITSVSPPIGGLQGRRDSLSLQKSATSTFSTTLGLAKLLNERGIHAMVPNTLKGKMASPTPTPCPSPETSPPPSPPPYDSVKVPDLLQEGKKGGALAKNAHLLRTNSQRKKKKKSAETVTRGQQTVLSIGLLEKLSRLSIDTISQSPPIVCTTSVTPAKPSTVGLASLVVQSPTGTAAPFPGGRECPLTYHRATGLASHKKIPESATLTFGSPRKTMLTTDTQVTLSSSRPIATVLPYSDQASGSSTNPVHKPETLLPIPALSSQQSDKVGPSWKPPTPMLKSPASLKLVPAMVPPLSRMPNPMLQLNCHLLQSQANRNNNNNNNNELVGTVGALRTLRKGGYA